MEPAEKLPEPCDGTVAPNTAEEDRAAKVQRLRAAVANGTYEVDSAKLSKAVIDKHITNK